MNPEPFQRLSRREWRGLAVMGLASAVILAAGFAFLRSTGPAIGPGSAQSNRPALLTFDAVSYHFATPSLGWAIENGTQDGGFAVFKTTDGARHWQKQMAAFSGSLGAAQLAFQFLDEEHAYIAAADPFQQLFRTSDGGGHWQAVRMPPRSNGVIAIAFSSPTYGWVMVFDQTAALYATSDAGRTWQRLPDPPPDADGLSFRNASEAWMGSAAVGPPHVYLSTDAGRSWQRRDLPPPRGPSWDSDVPAGVELLPYGGVHVFVPPVAQPQLVAAGWSETFTSFDQGATWTHLPPPPGATGYQDPRHWWAMNGTSLFKSSDAGQSWMLVTSALPDWQYIPHVLDSHHAWAGITIFAAAGLALTQDGGLHWSRGTVPPAASSIARG